MSVGQGGVKSTPIPQPLPPSQGGRVEDYYIIISALTEFKKIEVAIEGFNKLPEANLLII
ncbi:MAG: hypothetical protein LBF15_04490 [Candidatus Peribacteria bacterium]|jgi:hypothetical protein|nr:hypothetical protein [Candidatus Peribacteria bacterium]